LLAYLIWQGWQSLRSRTQPIWRMLIVPLVFFLMGSSRLLTARDNGLEPLLAWFVAALLFASLALSRGPRLLAVDKKRREVTRPGSAIPLARNVTVFRRGGGRRETGASHRRGDHRPRRIRRHCGLFFRLDRGAFAPLQHFRRNTD
jgi:hypothetical protein